MLFFVAFSSVLMCAPVVLDAPVSVSAPALPERAVPAPRNLRERVELVNRALACLSKLPLAQSGKEADSRISREVETELLPVCRELRKLPPEQLREALLLADAIQWQGSWMASMMMETAPDPVPMGVFELLIYLNQARLNADSPVEMTSLLNRVVAEIGGDAVAALPEKLIHDRLCRDYKTAKNFFDDYTHALKQGDAAALRELLPHVDYLVQEGEADLLRVSALAKVYSIVASLRDGALPTPPLDAEVQAVVQQIQQKLPAISFLSQ